MMMKDNIVVVYISILIVLSHLITRKKQLNSGLQFMKFLVQYWAVLVIQS